jgi:hypothetical protein
LYSNEIDKVVLFLGRCPFYTHIPKPSVFLFCACKKNEPLIPIISILVVGAPSFGLVTNLDSQVNPLRIGLGICCCPIDVEPSSREDLEQWLFKKL